MFDNLSNQEFINKFHTLEYNNSILNNYYIICNDTKFRIAIHKDPYYTINVWYNLVSDFTHLIQYHFYPDRNNSLTIGLICKNSQFNYIQNDLITLENIKFSDYFNSKMYNQYCKIHKLLQSNYHKGLYSTINVNSLNFNKNNNTYNIDYIIIPKKGL